MIESEGRFTSEFKSRPREENLVHLMNDVSKTPVHIERIGGVKTTTVGDIASVTTSDYSVLVTVQERLHRMVDSSTNLSHGTDVASAIFNALKNDGRFSVSYEAGITSDDISFATAPTRIRVNYKNILEDIEPYL